MRHYKVTFLSGNTSYLKETSSSGLIIVDGHGITFEDDLLSLHHLQNQTNHKVEIITEEDFYKGAKKKLNKIKK